MEPTPTFEMQFHKGAASGQENGQSDQKETNERRTSNIERPTSNNEFCLFNND
jgi:hypothetical protein